MSDISGVEAVVRSDAALLEEDLAAFLASLVTPPAPESVYEAALARSLYGPVADAVGSKVGQEALAPAAGAPACRAPLRPSMVFWAYRNYRGFPDEAGEAAEDLAAVRRAAVAVRVLLKAAVALDDIQDGSGVRYGEAALHVTHGVPLALNTGSLLIAAALEHAADPAVVRSLLQSVGRGFTGQAVDVSTRTALTRAQLLAAPLGERVAFWESMAALKTGTLFRMPLDAALAALGVVEDERRVLDEAMRDLGLASQLFNDLTDFVPGFGGRGTHEDYGQLSNRVFLELLDSAPAGRRASGELVGAGLKEFVLGHPELRATLLRLAAQAVELKRSAMEAVRGVCRGERSARYFEVTIERKGHLVDRLHTTLQKGEDA
ncbi:polyprenyl synthetase family protein [Streptomyces sp. NBC_01264]|uniref:polyprenyl synthetase family protein n=1 Tax=Streptomyces sp. NBC_01264 TaxID=2903804 RepID=UPI0022536CC7|nr:polyprenyl synthetase family protein [Streptomyces sp. NBC_01264]MCX4780679.1 polyprenyl synthetase family protein [Streptomyces sp. NBC_01264]